MHKNHAFTQLWHRPAVRAVRQALSPAVWLRNATSGLRPLPHFIIAGAQKAGTTSLFGYLEHHPNCLPALKKEVHFFDKQYTQGERFYRRHFPVAISAAARQRRVFESSPYYMFHPAVPRRIAQMIPQTKIILLLRNPVSRAYSHYQHNVMRGRETLSFEEALAAEPGLLAGEEARLLADENYVSAAHAFSSYLARGVYVEQLRRWYAAFPAEQLLVLEAEQLFKQPAQVFARVLQFLELPKWEPASYENLNTGRYREPMRPRTREMLEAYFHPHNQQLCEFLGWQPSWAVHRAAAA